MIYFKNKEKENQKLQYSDILEWVLSYFGFLLW